MDHPGRSMGRSPKMLGKLRASPQVLLHDEEGYAMTNEIALRVYPDLLFAYHKTSMLITDRAGAIEDGLQGLYDHDLRLISRYHMLVHGQAPRLDQISAVDHYSTLAYYVAPPTPQGGPSL